MRVWGKKDNYLWSNPDRTVVVGLHRERSRSRSMGHAPQDIQGVCLAMPTPTSLRVHSDIRDTIELFVLREREVI